MRVFMIILFYIIAYCGFAPSVFAQQASSNEGEQDVGTGGMSAHFSESQFELQHDRIKSVQRKNVLKYRRWEVTPIFTFSLNDAFYEKMGGGGALAFHPVDCLGIELQAIYLGTVQTDSVEYFQRANKALPKVDKLRYYAMCNVLWSPLYGKLSFVTDDIVHFDAYIIAGFGLVNTETDYKLASNFGVGLRYFINSWLVLKLELRDLVYTETFHMDIQGTDFSDIQNHAMFSVGLSFFLPPDFNYKFQ